MENRNMAGKTKRRLLRLAAYIRSINKHQLVYLFMAAAFAAILLLGLLGTSKVRAVLGDLLISAVVVLMFLTLAKRFWHSRTK